MKAVTNPSHQEATKRLLEEGVRSYLAAVTAIMAYEREVQAMCRRVMETYLDDYATALGIPDGLKRGEIADGVWPKSAESDEGWRSVGVAIEGQEIAPVIPWWGTYCSLLWDAERPDHVQCSINEWIGGPRKWVDEVLRRFSKLNPQIWSDGKELGLTRSLATDQAQAAEDTLGELFKEWIGMWKKVGGMQKVFGV